MSLNIEEQRKPLMRDGFIIVRGMISPDELERFRESVDAIVDRAPPSGRIVLTEWVDRQSADVLEYLFEERTLGLTRDLMDVPDAAPLGMWVLCSAGTGWHRDIHPYDMAPLDGLQEDIRQNGPTYLQWNIALYDDPFLHAIPGSHLRPNNRHEKSIERKMGLVPLPGATKIDLKAGDGVVYINNILHAAATSKPTKRRTLHLGHHAFGGRAFSHFYPIVSMGVDFIEYLSPQAAELCRHYDALHANLKEDVLFVLSAILSKDEAAFATGFNRIHPSSHARMTTAIVLSKTVNMMRKFRGSDDSAYPNGPDMQKLAEHFTIEELDELWSRFAVLDRKIQADEEIYEPLFQSGPTRYFFYEMPEDFELPDFIKSWAED